MLPDVGPSRVKSNGSLPPTPLFITVKVACLSLTNVHTMLAPGIRAEAGTVTSVEPVELASVPLALPEMAVLASTQVTDAAFHPAGRVSLNTTSVVRSDTVWATDSVAVPAMVVVRLSAGSSRLVPLKVNVSMPPLDTLAKVMAAPTVVQDWS